MSKNSFVGFRLAAASEVDAWGLSHNTQWQGRLTSVLQRNPSDFQLVIAADGDVHHAVRKATALLWDVLEDEDVSVEIERVVFDDIDCTTAVQDLVAMRRAFLEMDEQIS